MAKFKKKTKVSQSIPTSALPDIIFILLFFFMVVTKPREEDPKVEIDNVHATQVQERDQSKEKINLHIGYPMDVEKFGTEAKIELGGQFISPENVPQKIQEFIQSLPTKKQHVTNVIVALHVHKNVQMGVVIDVKQQLREVGARNIIYPAAQRTSLLE